MLHDKLLNSTPLFTPTWFSDAFIALFGYPRYILTQCDIYFSTFLFVQATVTLIVKLYKTISFKCNLKNNITLFSSIAHGFFNVLTARMVSDLHETQNKKPKSTLLKSTTILTIKQLHFLSILFNILHFLIILIKTFTRMTI